MRVAVDRQRVLGAGALENPFDHTLGVLHVALVVRRSRVVKARHRHAVLVALIGKGDAILGLRQELVEHADHRPVVVVAHVLAQRRPEMPVGEDVLGPADRKWRDCLNAEATRKPAALVGLIELL